MTADKIKQLISLPNTYIGEAPIAIDNCQWIRPSAGSSTVHFGRKTYDRPTFSIYVRGTTNGETAERCAFLFNLLRNRGDSTWALLARRLPSFVGKDEKHRSIYTFQLEYQSGG